MSKQRPNFLTSSVELFKNLNTDVKNNDESADVLIRKVNVLTGEVLQVRKKIAEAERNVFEVNAESSLLKNENNRLNEEMLSLKAKYRVVAETLEGSRNKVRLLNEKFAKKDRELMDAKDELVRQKAAHEELTSNLEFTQKHVSSGDKQFQNLERENSRLKSIINQLTREKERLRGQASTSVEISKKMEEPVAQWNNQLLAFRMRLEKEIVAREVRLSCAFEKLKKLAKWTYNLGSELKRRVEKENKLKKKIVALEKLVEERRQNSRGVKSAQARKIKQLTQEKQVLERKLLQSELKISSLQMTSKYQITSMKGSLEQELQQFRAQCEKFRSEMESNRVELSSQRAESTRLRNELQQEKQDRRRLLEHVDDIGRMRNCFMSLQQATATPGEILPLGNRSAAKSNHHRRSKVQGHAVTQECVEGMPQGCNSNALYDRLGHLIKKMEDNLS